MMVLAALIIWVAAWALNVRLAAMGRTLLVPLIFGLTIIVVWQLLVRGLGVDRVILPAPTEVAATFADNIPTLWADFVQTILKGALGGYLMGVIAALVVAVLVDRYGFLQRGLMPIANFMAALPIVGVAPIMVMWFGFDWQSKAAVVVIMVFFPMLVNTVAGLADTTAMQRDLMRTYGASYLQTLFRLRLPAALPFIFNGLKIAATLSLVGAIVAEFFGSPTVGLGFRINASLGQLSLDMVWAVIVVAALAGSLFYGLLTLAERALTFWHPSQRSQRH